MELFAIIVLVVWALGIVSNAIGIVRAVNDADSDPGERIRQGMDSNPVLVTTLATVVVIFWPAALIYSLTNRK